MPAKSSSRPVNDNDPRSVVRTSLLVFCSCLAILTTVAWGISLYCSQFLHLGYPFNTPLFDPAVRFTDLTDFYERARNLQASSIGASLNYPAPALFVYAFFVRL